MEENNTNEQNNINSETKETVEKQLDSFINPIQKPAGGSDNIVSNSATEIKTDPLIKEVDIPAVEEEKKTKSIIRTYKSDVEETIQAGHVSSINIALAEEKKRLGQAKQTEIDIKKTKINKNILIVSLVLIFGGALTFFIPQMLIKMNYGEKKTPTETVSSEPLMTVDSEEKMNIKDINLNRVGTTLKERVDQSATRLGQIKNVYLTEGTDDAEKLITSSKFLKLIGTNIPSEIQRTLKDQYMFGFYNYNGNQRFLILKVGEYDTTFSGMLYWETNLWQDFKEIFDLKNSELDNTKSVVNSFGIEVKKFQDATFNNKDCRIVKDSKDNIIFLYSIIDQNTIVITTSTDTLKEIINRISKTRVITQ